MSVSFQRSISGYRSMRVRAALMGGVNGKRAFTVRDCNDHYRIELPQWGLEAKIRLIVGR